MWLHIRLDKEPGKKFRKVAIKRHGNSLSSLTKAVEEAVEDWMNKEET